MHSQNTVARLTRLNVMGASTLMILVLSLVASGAVAGDVPPAFHLTPHMKAVKERAEQNCTALLPDNKHLFWPDKDAMPHDSTLFWLEGVGLETYLINVADDIYIINFKDNLDIGGDDLVYRSIESVVYKDGTVVPSDGTNLYGLVFVDQQLWNKFYEFGISCIQREFTNPDLVDDGEFHCFDLTAYWRADFGVQYVSAADLEDIVISELDAVSEVSAYFVPLMQVMGNEPEYPDEVDCRVPSAQMMAEQYHLYSKDDYGGANNVIGMWGDIDSWSACAFTSDTVTIVIIDREFSSHPLLNDNVDWERSKVNLSHEYGTHGTAVAGLAVA